MWSGHSRDCNCDRCSVSDPILTEFGVGLSLDPGEADSGSAAKFERGLVGQRRRLQPRDGLSTPLTNETTRLM